MSQRCAPSSSLHRTKLEVGVLFTPGDREKLQASPVQNLHLSQGAGMVFRKMPTYSADSPE